jgi:hypothetical protein
MFLVKQEQQQQQPASSSSTNSDSFIIDNPSSPYGRAMDYTNHFWSLPPPPPPYATS